MGSHHGMLGFGESDGSGQPNGGLQHHPGVHAWRLVRPCGGPLGRVYFRARFSALLSRGKACGRSRASDLWVKVASIWTSGKFWCVEVAAYQKRYVSFKTAMNQTTMNVMNAYAIKE